MSDIRKLAGQTVVYGLSSIVPRFLNYMLVPLHARIFLPEEYGVITELYAYVTFLIIILTYGMETGFFRFSKDEQKRPLVYTTALIALLFTSLFFVALVYFFLPQITGLLDYSKHPEYITCFAWILAIDAFTTIPFAKLRQENKAYWFAGIKIVSVLVNIILNLVFLKILNHGVKPDVGLVFLANLYSSIFTLVLLSPILFGFKWKFDFSLFKSMLVYVLPLLIAGLAGNINEAMDRVLLKYLLPDNVNAMAQLGIYGANVKIAVLMTLFIQMFRYAYDPFFFNKGTDAKAKQVYAEVMNYFVIAGLIIFLSIMSYMDIIKYFVGVSYWEGLKVVPIALLANLMLGVFYNLSIWYKLEDKTKYGAYLTIFGAVVTILVNFLLVPLIGYMGSGWARLITYSSMVFVSFYFGQKFMMVPYNLPKLLFYFVLTICLYILMRFVRTENSIVNIVVGSLILATFIAIIEIKEKLLSKLILRRWN